MAGPAVITAWVQVANILIGAGVATVNGVKALIASHHGQTMSETELNDLTALVLNDAMVRKAIADADAAPTSPA